MPESSISRQASRVPHRTKSRVTFFASAGKMNFSSQSCSRRSSAMPRKRRHRGVGMGVDQARSDQRVGPVEALPRRNTCGRFRRAGRRNDAFAANRDCAVFNDAALGIHGDDITALQIQSAGSACRPTATRRRTLQKRRIEGPWQEIMQRGSRPRLPCRLARHTSMSPQNSHRIWRHAPQGGVSIRYRRRWRCGGTCARLRKCALNTATRSAQRLRP